MPVPYLLLENGDRHLLEDGTGDQLLNLDIPAASLYSRRWNYKPAPGAQLDPAHPICPDYCWPILSPQGMFALLTRRVRPPASATAIYSGSQTIVPNPRWALAIRHGATGDRWVLADNTTDADAIVGLDGNFTLFIASKKNDATLRNSTIFGVDTLTSGNRCQIHCPFSDGNVYFDYGGSTNGATRVQATGLTFGEDLWCFNVGPRGMEIWQNGILQASNSATPTRGSGSGGATGSLGGPANPTFADLQETGLIMSWRRQLTATEIQSIFVNPWQVFQPQARLLVATETVINEGIFLPVRGQRWNRKPIPGVQLDPNHPHCPDFCWPFLGPSDTPQLLTRNVAFGQPTAPVGTPTWVPGGKYGLSLRHGAVTDIMRFVSTAAQSDQILGFSSGFTLLVAYRKNDATARGTTVFGVDGNLSDTSSAYLFVDNNGGFTGFTYGGSAGAALAQVANGSLVFGDDLWCATSGPRGTEVWQNGIMVAQNVTAGPSRTAALTTCINTGQCLVAWPAGQANFSDLADMAFVMTWKRQLSTAAIRELYVNPWQVFQPQMSLYAGEGVFIPPVVATASGYFSHTLIP
jgi:hypothetical protein